MKHHPKRLKFFGWVTHQEGVQLSKPIFWQLGQQSINHFPGARREQWQRRKDTERQKATYN